MNAHLITGRPLLPPNWSAQHLPAGAWVLFHWGSNTASGLQESHLAVTDDHGTLTLLNAEASHQFWLWDRSEDPEDSAADWLAAQIAAEHARIKARDDAEQTRALLRPPPVTAEICTDQADEFVSADILVGHDVRRHCPRYRLVVAGEEPITVTHAQLAALMLAGQQILAACQPQEGQVLQ
jgi:hypothetical protein